MKAHPSEPPLPKSLFLVFLAPFLIRLIIPWFDLHRAWGMDYLQYLPYAWQIIWTVAGLGAIPFLSGTLDSKSIEKKYSLILLLVFSAITVVLFAYPADLYFYGDGQSIIADIYRVSSNSKFEPEMVLNARSGALTGIVTYGITRTVPWIWNVGAGMLHWQGKLGLKMSYPFVWLSGIALAILSFVFFRVAKKDSHPTALLLTFLGLAGTLLLFGYVEFYGLVYVMLFWYLVVADRTLKGTLPLRYAVFLYFLTVASHSLLSKTI